MNGHATLKPSRVNKLLAAARKSRLLVVGDVMLDQFIWGNVGRISPEAPVPVVDFQRESFMPGGAANVARNLIAHEIGHAIGLGHNADFAALMCGRPATCRPEAFRSGDARYFPLLDGEKKRLLELYPANWVPTLPGRGNL